jgi:hypothetical protein
MLFAFLDILNTTSSSFSDVLEDLKKGDAMEREGRGLWRA